MSSPPKTFLTEAEYLEQERRADHKSEFYQGEVFAMAGASRWHAWIVTNVLAELARQLKRKPCHIAANDLRLRVTETGLYTYPDIVVVCGDAQFTDDQFDTLTNPTLIVEVLSPSTSDYDRGRKFEHYRTLPSLKEYLTIAQDAPHVEHWTRQPENHWLLAEYGEIGQTVELASIDCVLPLREIYDKIDFPPRQESQGRI